MPNKTIAKFLNFVILTAILSSLGASCARVNTGPGMLAETAQYGPAEIIGTIKSVDVIESSGIAASRCQSNVFWTHNDSGDRAFIFAFNRSGDSLGSWLVQGAENRDWEDIATWKDNTGKCFIYIGEIGDNKRLWPEHAVIRVVEPMAISKETATTRGNVPDTMPPEVIRYTYPYGDDDAEALMVHPVSGDIFVLTKNESGPSKVYRLKGDFGTSPDQTAIKVAEISLPAVPNGLITGGDISPDGRRMIVCDYSQAYEFELPESSTDFDEIWTQRPQAVDIGRRKTGESICYGVDGSEIFATSEGRNPPIISVRRRKLKKVPSLLDTFFHFGLGMFY